MSRADHNHLEATLGYTVCHAGRAASTLDTSTLGEANMAPDVNRRDALKLGAGVGATVALTDWAQANKPKQDTEAADPRLKPIPRIRVGLVGIGGRGYHLLRLLLGQPDVEVKAVCDLLEDRCQLAQKTTVSAGQPTPDA